MPAGFESLGLPFEGRGQGGRCVIYPTVEVWCMQGGAEREEGGGYFECANRVVEMRKANGCGFC